MTATPANPPGVTIPRDVGGSARERHDTVDKDSVEPSISPLSAQASQVTSNIGSGNGVAPTKRIRAVDKKGRKVRRALPAHNRTPWPPKSLHGALPTSQQQSVDNKQPMLNAVPQAIADTPSSTGHQNGPSSHKEVDLMRVVSQESPVEVVQSLQPRALCSKDSLPLLHATPAWSKTLDDGLHSVDERARPMRVVKPPRKASAHVPARRSETPVSGDLSDPLCQKWEGMLVTLYSDLKEVEKRHAFKMEACRETIAALQGRVDEQKDHIRALEADKMTLHAKTKDVQEKAKRYMKGMETDHVKFKAETKAHHQKYSEILNEKIANVQNEKVALEKEFLATIVTMEKSHRSMRGVLDDCFGKLIISESRKCDLTTDFEKQRVVLEEERERRKELELQVKTSSDTLQRYLDTNSSALLEQLATLQNSVDTAVHDENRDAFFRECADALKDLRQRPTLTCKDVAKAEGMLRFVHER